MAERRTPVSGVSGLILEVSDLPATERFYSEVLGLPIVERWEGRGVTWVMAGERSRIGLWIPQVRFAGGQPGAHVYFAMHIPEKDYDVLAERLRSHGCAFTESTSSPPREGRAAYVRMPTGTASNSGDGTSLAISTRAPSGAGRPDDSSLQWLVAITPISGRTSDQNVAAIRRAPVCRKAGGSILRPR
jgi:predicted enzyme related to lactoylglutathione lyase